jgi:hypothetical protein
MGLPLMEDQVRLGCHQIKETRIHGRDMTPEQLVQIKAALGTVTPGPWVFQAVGEASGCWIGGTGDAVFDEAAAVRCADSLIEDLRAMGVNL